MSRYWRWQLKPNLVSLCLKGASNYPSTHVTERSKHVMGLNLKSVNNSIRIVESQFLIPRDPMNLWNSWIHEFQSSILYLHPICKFQEFWPGHLWIDAMLAAANCTASDDVGCLKYQLLSDFLLENSWKSRCLVNRNWSNAISKSNLNAYKMITLLAINPTTVTLTQAARAPWQCQKITKN